MKWKQRKCLFLTKLNFWSSTIELFRIKPAQLVSHHRCKHTDCYYATVCNVLTEAQLEIVALWLFQEIPTVWSLPPLSQISFIIVQSSALKKQWKLFRNVSFSDKTNRVKLDNGICRIKLIKTMFKRTLKLQKKLLLVMLPMIKTSTVTKVVYL